MAHAVVLPLMVTGPLRPVFIWLLTGCVLIVCMVAIGGITRLTDSGLSITEWDPIMGAIPPLDQSQWEEAFAKYKRIPEYTLSNPDMDLSGFKQIFFWEYLHRNWGRFMGLVFAIPFLVFWRKGLLKGWLLKRTLFILLGGGSVGALGWFMVVSGLQDRVDVSHYRLAIHLVAALSVFALVLWTVFDIRHGHHSFRGDGTPAATWGRVLLVVVTIQIVWGAFTAGLDAGRIYNTWPLMNGEFMPENVLAFGNWITDLTDHKDGVQFVHRNLAWAVAIGAGLFAWCFRKEATVAMPGKVLIGAVSLQFVLGVWTVLLHVPIHLGVAHQLGAVLVLASLIRALHATGRMPNAT